MQRIVILGVTGSGKTTFGRKLAARLGVPATDLDDLHWLPGWTERSREEFVRLAGLAAAGPSWVIIGNYSKARGVIWPRADTAIWLDYAFPRVFWQLLRRSVLRAIDKNPICNGNIESWRQFFSKKSIMLWLFASYRKRRRDYEIIFTGASGAGSTSASGADLTGASGAGSIGGTFDAGGKSPNITYVRFKTPAAAESWLQNIKA